MSPLWVLVASAGPIALVFVACGGSGSHPDSRPVTQSGGAGQGGAGLAGAGAALAGGGTALGGSAGQATTGGGGQAAGTQSNGGTGWIVPAAPGAGWSGPQDPACPSAVVSADAACTSPPGTRCSYPEPGGTYTLRCQCYVSSTGADRWWCEQHASIAFDLCPIAYPGKGSCPNIGDVTCYYVDDQHKLEACNCAAGSAQCFPWGL